MFKLRHSVRGSFRKKSALNCLTFLVLLVSGSPETLKQGRLQREVGGAEARDQHDGHRRHQTDQLPAAELDRVAGSHARHRWTVLSSRRQERLILFLLFFDNASQWSFLLEMWQKRVIGMNVIFFMNIISCLIRDSNQQLYHQGVIIFHCQMVSTKVHTWYFKLVEAKLVLWRSCQQCSPHVQLHKRCCHRKAVHEICHEIWTWGRYCRD